MCVLVHDPGELEHGHASGERVRRERRAQIVDPCRLPDPGGLDRGRPLAPAPVVQVEQTAAHGGEEERRVEPRWDGVKRRERASGQRHLPPRSCGLPELDDLAIGDRRPHAQHSRVTVYVTALERPDLRQALGLGIEAAGEVDVQLIAEPLPSDVAFDPASGRWSSVVVG